MQAWRNGETGGDSIAMATDVYDMISTYLCVKYCSKLFTCFI